MTLTNIIRWASGLAVAISIATGAVAQEYPNKPIRIVVPIGAGGPTDIVGRMIFEKLSAELKVPIVIDNKPGASGLIGTREVAGAAPDGYTLLYTVSSFYTAAPLLYPDRGIDMKKLFIPISFGHNQNMALIVDAQLPIKNFKDFLAYNKANTVRYGTPGAGSSPHMIMEVLKKRLGLDLIHVPYKSGAEFTQATIAGQINANIEMVSNVVGHVEAGKLRAIAVTGPTRSKSIPDVPTLRELGVDFESSSWGALAAPAGTPAAIVTRLHQAMVKVMKDPELLGRLDKLGAEVQVASSDELQARIASDTAMWAEVIKELGLARK
jgi:tripartite-type tricarboxylate transporter receptor subunit TctC